MRAVVITEFGGPEVLELVEDHPSARARRRPGADQGVSGAGINFADTHARENSYLATYELPLIPGTEVAGEVDGRRVVALTGTGGYAEYAVAPRRRVFPLPDGVSDTAALALDHPGPQRLAPAADLRAPGRGRERRRPRRRGRRRLARGPARQALRRRPRDRDRLDRGQARAGARARRRRRGRPQRGGPRRRAARGQRRRQGRHRARDGRRPRVRPVAARAGAVRPPRHLRPGLARAEPGLQRRADGAAARPSSASGSCTASRGRRR